MKIKENKILKNLTIGILGILSLVLFLMINIKINAAESNLIKNPSVETANPITKLPEGWYKDFWGANTRAFSYPVVGQDSSKAVKVELKKVISGDAKWAFVDVAVNAGQKYEYSDYYQSNIKSYLVVRYLLKNGTYKYVDLATLDPADSWEENKVQFTIPPRATALTVYHLIKNVGFLTTDNFSFNLISAQPTSIPSVIPTNTSTPTQGISPTSLPTTVLTQTPTNQPTSEPSVTDIPNTPIPTVIPSESPTELPTQIPTVTDTITPEPTNSNPTETPEITPITTEIPTPSSNPTEIPTATPTIENPTPTETPVPTNVPTSQPTSVPTPVPTSTPTNLGLVVNGDLETLDQNTNLPSFWYQGNWGTNTVKFSYPVSGNNSSKAVAVEVSAITDGDAKWYFADVSAEPGSMYTFSDNYISNVVTRVVVRYKLSDGSYSYDEIGTANPTNSWGTFSQTIVPPANAVALTVFHLVDKVGSLTIDNVSLNKQTNPNVLSQGMVSLDFDDGWSSTFNNGLPIVNSAGFKSTLYIISQYLGEPEYITKDQMLSAQSAGNEIGAHSKTHPELPLLTSAQMQEEIGGSRLDLLSYGAKPVNSFSYPYGEYNDTVLSLVKSAGFVSARTALMADGGFNDKSTNSYLLKTQSVESTTTLADIQNWIDTATKNKTWLILVMHQVDNSGSQYSITPEKLQSIVNYLKTNNVKVVSASEGVSILKQ